MANDNDGDLGGTAKDRLINYIQRIENLIAEKDAITADIREIYAEAKNGGLDTKTMRKMVKERAMEPDILADELAACEQMRRDLGMLVDTPLGDAAIGENRLDEAA